MLKLNASVVSEIKELTALLSALKTYKGWDGPNYVDKASKLLERRLNEACKELLEGRDDVG